MVPWWTKDAMNNFYLSLSPSSSLSPPLLSPSLLPILAHSTVQRMDQLTHEEHFFLSHFLLPLTLHLFLSSKLLHSDPSSHFFLFWGQEWMTGKIERRKSRREEETQRERETGKRSARSQNSGTEEGNKRIVLWSRETFTFNDIHLRVCLLSSLFLLFSPSFSRFFLSSLQEMSHSECVFLHPLQRRDQEREEHKQEVSSEN